MKNVIKKLTVTVLSLLMLFCALIPVHAESSFGTVSADVVHGAEGDTVTVPVRYSKNSGFWIMFLNVNFDSSILKYTGYENGTYKDIDITVNTYEDKGKLLLDIEGSQFQNVSGDGILANLKFEIVGGTPASNYAIMLSIGEGMACDYDAGYVEPDIVNGSVYVVCRQHHAKNGICDICGAVIGEENVSIDKEKLPEEILPDADIPENSAVGVSPLAKKPDNGNSPNKYVILLFSALSVIIILAVIIFAVIKNRKTKKSEQ